MQLKYFIQAARPKTLPLAVAGPIFAAAMASISLNWNIWVCIWQIITAILLQILSNFANDLGDFLKGTDTKAKRTDRALSSGKLSVKEVKSAVFALSLLSLFSGLILLKTAFVNIHNLTIAFFVLGLLAIVAAIKYTLGKSAFGYKSLGDIVVFIFFGLVAVAGGFYLHTQAINYSILLLSITVGFLSVAVLNINNIRDIASDLKNNKHTIANKLGKPKALKYHIYLLFFACLCMVLALALHVWSITDVKTLPWKEWAILPFVFLPFFVFLQFHYQKLKVAEQREQYNAELKNVSLLTFVLSIYWCCLAFLLF